VEFLNDGVVAVPGEPPSHRVTREERRRLDELRVLLARLTDTIAAGAQLSPGELAELNEVIGRLPVRAQLQAEPGGSYVVDFAPVGGAWIERVERELSGAFASILRRSYPPRLKRCADEGCRRFFYDETRSRTRRWCDSRTCGNRSRVRRHRGRATGRLD
jgi:predicted RNA-binding Zn ribbon-like protein